MATGETGGYRIRLQWTTNNGPAQLIPKTHPACAPLWRPLFLDPTVANWLEAGASSDELARPSTGPKAGDRRKPSREARVCGGLEGPQRGPR